MAGQAPPSVEKSQKLERSGNVKGDLSCNTKRLRGETLEYVPFNKAVKSPDVGTLVSLTSTGWVTLKIRSQEKEMSLWNWISLSPSGWPHSRVVGWVGMLNWWEQSVQTRNDPEGKH